MQRSFTSRVVADFVYQAFAVSNVSAFLYWIGADNTTSNSALILLDDDSVQVSARLWAFAQFSRFVKPGAVRIDATTNTNALNVTAFQNEDSTVAVQVINNGNTAQSIDLEGLPWGHASTVKSYLTNNRNDLKAGTVNVQGGKLRDRVPAYAMKSYVT